ncbi:DUF397 domain-containing protein [Yinghuangia soli]|uniref:DUF397 domain-containing protein n=1 Tax=Yinghuangia soli TaxID=2908204 RepID=A0AA41Q5U6_9ACTN|nr:DUF397 domain-containing protein [Yinghuangia soli]MCF2531787.1 DUF397 domain-containing protein [Yinghuangia soli]
MAGVPSRWIKSSYSAQNGECTEVRWTKSSHSNQNGECTEVAAASGRTEVRDSKRPGGPRLAFDAGAWSVFLAGVAGSAL